MSLKGQCNLSAEQLRDSREGSEAHESVNRHGQCRTALKRAGVDGHLEVFDLGPTHSLHRSGLTILSAHDEPGANCSIVCTSRAWTGNLVKGGKGIGKIAGANALAVTTTRLPSRVTVTCTGWAPGSSFDHNVCASSTPSAGWWPTKLAW